MKAIGAGIYVIAGLIGFIGAMGFISKQFGFIAGFVAFMFFPATIAFTPLYFGFANGNWNLLEIVYGGAIVGTICYGIGD